MIVEYKNNGEVTSRCLNRQGYPGGLQHPLPGAFLPSEIRRNSVMKFEDFKRVMLLRHKPEKGKELKQKHIRI